MRLGSKLLLLVSSDEGTHPIAEVTDAEEVEYLSNLCANGNQAKRIRSSSPQSTGSTIFRKALDRTQKEGANTDASLDNVIRRLAEVIRKPSRTDFEA